MKEKLFLYTVFAAILVSITTAGYAGQTLSSGGHATTLHLYLHPGHDGLVVRVVATTPQGGFNCTGLVEKNLYYRETRAISDSLVLLPLYYVLDKTCPRLASLLAGLREGLVEVVVEAPQGYAVLTSMDLRGYGGPGSYTLPARLFSRHYLYDSILVYSLSSYGSALVNKSLVVVYPKGLRGDVVKTVALAAIHVKKALSSMLGPSPRSPVALVLASPGEHPFTGGYHYSTASIIYISLPERPGDPENLLELVHAAAHEAVHGWINHGMLWGNDYLVSEGTTEYLALLSLHTLSPGLLDVIDKRIVSVYIEAKSRYGLGLLANAGLRQAALSLCGEDAYIAGLRRLYQEALSKNITGVGPVSFTDLVEASIRECSNSTARAVLEAVAPIVLVETLSGSIGEPSWPYIGAGDVERALMKIRGACEALAGSGEPVATSATSGGGAGEASAPKPGENSSSSVEGRGLEDTGGATAAPATPPATRGPGTSSASESGAREAILALIPLAVIAVYATLYSRRRGPGRGSSPGHRL